MYLEFLLRRAHSPPDVWTEDIDSAEFTLRSLIGKLLGQIPPTGRPQNAPRNGNPDRRGAHTAEL